MNKELQNQLSTILQGVINTADNASAFLIEEMPDVIQQLLMWKMFESVFYASFLSVIILIMAIYSLMRGVGNIKKLIEAKSYGERTPTEDRFFDVTLIETLVIYLGSVLPIMIALANFNLTWLQIWLAPKIYLMEYASELIK